MIYFEELDHTVVEAGEGKFCRAAHQAGNSNRSWYCSLETKFLLQRPGVCSPNPSTWLDTVQSYYRAYSPLLKVNYNYKIPSRQHVEECLIK